MPDEKKLDYNVFALAGDKVTDEKIIELLGLTPGTEHTTDISLELLDKARVAQKKEYPREAEEIDRMFNNAVYYLKLKLAARGMYHND